MSDKESAKSVIDSYRKRQQMSQRMPVIIMIVAGLLLVVGAAAVIFWMLGPEDRPLFPPRTTDTPTITVTHTVKPSPTATDTPTETATALPTDTPTPSETPTPSGPFEYTVQEGDTLGTIADRFQTDLQTILALNPQIDATTLVIHVGDKLLIPAPDTELPTATPLPENISSGTIIEYTVVVGDTLEAIAARFNSTVEAILKQNPDVENANDIFAGQILKIPVNLVTPIPTATVGTVFPTANVPTNTPAATGTPTP